MLAMVAGGMAGLLSAQAQEAKVPARPETVPATFEAGLARVLELEEDAEFAKALLTGEELAGQFASHPDAGKFQEVLQRIKEEKNEARSLPPAVEKLGSASAAEVEVARGIFSDAGDTGAIFLRKAVRTGSAKSAETAISILENLEDAKAAPSYARRLHAEGKGPLAAVLARALDARLRAMDKDNRAIMAGPLGQLYDRVATDTNLLHRTAADMVLLIYSTWFEQQPASLETFLVRPGAMAILKDYVARADKSDDRAMSEWACPWLSVVGLDNTSGLVGWWKFDDRKGEVARDYSGGGHAGQLKGTCTWSVEGPGALNFDGATSVVTTDVSALSSITNSFTMLLWAKPGATCSLIKESNSGVGGTRDQRYAIYPSCLIARDRSGAGISIGTNGVQVFEHSDSYIPALLSHPVALTNWTHVAVVYQKQQPTLYLDGKPVKTGVASLRNVSPSATFGDSGSKYGSFAGQLRDVRIYNRALSAAELEALAKTK